ncbi:hypothetical protein [Nocardia beijingensis]|uniref:hypothetical protein n=1 Tax=Nocardia beijingensis TaxID=95162 RepID=UPI0033E75588
MTKRLVRLSHTGCAEWSGSPTLIAMTATDLLALIAITVLVLQNAARIPAALAELLRACQPLVEAVRDLTAIATSSVRSGMNGDLNPTDSARDSAERIGAMPPSYMPARRDERPAEGQPVCRS